MPKYYCDYCDTYLTHDSPSVRKTHCAGRKHKENVKFYYQKWMEEQAQSLIDATTAAFKAGKLPGGMIKYLFKPFIGSSNLVNCSLCITSICSFSLVWTPVLTVISVPNRFGCIALYRRTTLLTSACTEIYCHLRVFRKYITLEYK